MLDLLKNSKGELLKLFYREPEKEYYLRELARIFEKEPSYLQNALNFLVAEGIIKDERKGNLRFFKLNQEYPLYEEIKKIISKTVGIEAKLKELINKFAGVKYAFIYGSVARGNEHNESDIDLLLIGAIDQDLLIKRISELEIELSREINFQIFSEEEVTKKINEKNDFFIRIFSESIIDLKNNINEFTKSRKFS